MTGCVAVLAVGTPALAAQERDGGALGEVLATFHERSPELALARARLDRSIAQARQGRALPNPTAFVSTEDVGDYSEQYYNLSQRIDFLWSAGPRGRDADARVAQARARFSADSARLVRDVRATWMRALAAAERAEALAEAASGAEGLRDDVQSRFDEGDLSGYDLRRAELALRGLIRRAGIAEVEGREAVERLAALVSGHVSGITGVDVDAAPTGPPPLPDAGAVAEWASMRRPELAEARAGIDIGRAQASLARGSLLAGTAVTGGYKQQSNDRDGYYLALSVPLPLLDRKSGAVEAAEASVLQAEATLRVVESVALREASVAHARLRAARDVWTMTAEEGLQDGSELLDIARVAYDEGEIGIEEMLEAVNAFVEARLAAVEVRADAWIAYYELDRATGGLGDPSMDGGNE